MDQKKMINFFQVAFLLFFHSSAAVQEKMMQADQLVMETGISSFWPCFDSPAENDTPAMGSQLAPGRCHQWH